MPWVKEGNIKPSGGSNHIHIRQTRSAAINVAHAADVVIPMNVAANVIHPPNDFWTIISGEIQVPTTGWYMAVAGVRWDGNTVGGRILNIQIGGSNVVSGMTPPTVMFGSAGVFQQVVSPPFLIHTRNTQRVRVTAMQDSGATRQVVSDVNATYLAITRLLETT